MFAIEFFGTTVSVLQIAIGLGFVIFVHELGHFLVAKWADVRVERFSLGFGPRLWTFTRGETEYCLSLIPLGGYVKMAGEEPGEEKKGDGREFNTKPIRWRVAILLAGVGMNTLTSFPLLTAAVLFGGNFPSNLSSAVGSVAPGSAAEKAGLKSGDWIVRINGERVSRWFDVAHQMRQSVDVGRLDMEVDRGGSLLRVSLEKPFWDPADFGISTFWPDRIGPVEAGSPLDLAGIREGDAVVSVEGAPFSPETFRQAILSRSGGTLRLEFRRPGGERYEAGIAIQSQEVFDNGLELELVDLPIVGQVVEGKPAHGAGMRPGDRVLKIQETPVANWTDLRHAIRNSVASPLVIEVAREAQTLRLSVTPTEDLIDGRTIGVTHQSVYKVTQVRKPATADPRIRIGDLLIDAHTQTQGKSYPLYALADYSTDGATVAVALRRDGEQIRSLVTPQKIRTGSLSLAPYLARAHSRAGVFAAIGASFREAGWILRYHVQALSQMARSIPRGDAKALQQVSGPIGIAALTYKATQLGLDYYFWILGLVSLILALMNVLPIPLLDGGHLLFLGIEKLRGKPLSERVQVYIQYAALAFLLSLVLVATWNDYGNLPRIFKS